MSKLKRALQEALAKADGEELPEEAPEDLDVIEPLPPEPQKFASLEEVMKELLDAAAPEPPKAPPVEIVPIRTIEAKDIAPEIEEGKGIPRSELKGWMCRAEEFTAAHEDDWYVMMRCTHCNAEMWTRNPKMETVCVDCMYESRIELAENEVKLHNPRQTLAPNPF